MRGIKVKSSKVTNQGAEVVFDVEKAIEEMNVTAAELESLRAEKAELIEALRSIKDRLQIVMSEPNGIVRETMINNLLIDIP
jgi:chromosome segregation ATPase